MNVLFDSRAGILELFARLHKLVTDNNTPINPYTVVHTGDDYLRAQRIGIEPIGTINNYLRDNWNNFDISRQNIARIEETYLKKPFNYITTIDYVLHCAKDEEIKKKYFVGYFNFYNTIFSETTFNIFISEVIVGLWNYIPYLLCKHYNIRYMGFTNIRLADRFSFINDEFNTIPQLKDKCFSSTNSVPNGDVIRIINKITIQKKQPTYT